MHSLRSTLVLVLPMLASCGGSAAPEPYRLGLSVRYLTGQEDLFDGREVKLVIAPPGADPTVTSLGVAEPGRTLSLPNLPALAAGTRVGLLAEEPGGPANAWDPSRTVGYGDILLQAPLGAGAAADLEILVPAMGAVGTLDTIPEGRRRMRAATVMLPDGRVYTFGGVAPDDWNDGASDQILVLDGVDSGDTTFDPIATRLPETRGLWIDNSELRYSGRVDLGASVLADGRVLLTGGRAEYLSPWAASDQWLLFDPADESIPEKGRLPVVRMEHLSIPFRGGTVLLFGGATGNNIFEEPTFDLFDPATLKASGSFYPDQRPLPGVNRCFGAAYETDVVVCGGDYADASALRQDWLPQPGCVRIQPTGDVEAFDPLPVPLAGATMTALPDGLLVVGGFSDVVSDQLESDGQGNTYIVDVGSAAAQSEIYRWTRAQGWRKVADLEYPRAHHAAVPLADGRILIVGGDTEGGALFAEYEFPVRCPEIFDPADDSVSPFDCSDTGSGAYVTAVNAPGTDILVLSGYLYPSGTRPSGLDRIGYTAFGPPLPLP